MPETTPAALVPRPHTWGDPDHFLLALDSPWYRTITALHDEITVATVEFWRGRGVRNMYLPITTSSVSSPMGLGSDSLPVEIDLFGVRTNLADSMQFMLEYGCRLHSDGAYYLMPSFRGEAPDASHLCQFFHSEAEIPGGLDDVIAAVEDYLAHLSRAMLVHADGIRQFTGTVAHLEAQATRTCALPRLTLDDAAGELADVEGGVVPGPDGSWRTLTRVGEHELMRRLGGYVWVTHFDHLSVPFYQAFAGPDHRSALNADLLFGVGETVGSGERHVTGAQMDTALDLHRVAREPYQWYARMKDASPMRTAGFGLGIERFLMWVLDHDDIRDLQLLPRTNGRRDVP